MYNKFTQVNVVVLQILKNRKQSRHTYRARGGGADIPPLFKYTFFFNLYSRKSTFCRPSMCVHYKFIDDLKFIRLRNEVNLKKRLHVLREVTLP